MPRWWTWIKRLGTPTAVPAYSCAGDSKDPAGGLRRDDFDIFRGDYQAQQERGFRPRNGAPPVRLSIPLDWNMDPLGDRNWRFHLHAWRMLDPIWREFHGRDWTRLREEVMPWIRDWHRYHVVESKDSEFAWYDMSTAFRAQHLAMLVTLHDSGAMPLSDADVHLVRELAALHHQRLRNPSFIALNNHGVFQILGLRLLGVACAGRSEFVGEPDYSSRMLHRLLDAQFDRNGVHVENSPDYHGLILKQFARLRPQLFPKASTVLATTVAKAKEVLPWFTLPDGRIATIGDSEGLSVALGGNARADHSISDEQGQEVLVRDLASSGYIIVRSSAEVPADAASMLIMRGRSPSFTHAHVDGLSLMLYDKGRMIFTDPGKYTYAKGPWREFFTSDRAHNVVGVKGVRMAPHHLPSSGDTLALVDAGPEAVLLEGRVTRREWFEHTRQVRYVPSRSVDVTDHVSARPDDAPVVYWHLAPGLDAERARGGVDIYDNGVRVASMRVHHAEAKAKLVHGREAPLIQGWVSTAYGKKVPATVIEFHCPPGTSTIQTTIELEAAHQGAPASGTMPRRLTHGVRFNFPHQFRRDRIAVLPDGHTQRRVVVALPEPDLKRIARRLDAVMTGKGFKAARHRIVEDVVRLGYQHSDGTKVIAKLRGPTPESTDGMGSLYFAWSRLAE